MGKRANVMASVLVGWGGGLKVLPPAEVTVSRDLPAVEQTVMVVEDIGQGADDASSVYDVAKKAEATEDQLTSESDAHPSPGADPEGDDPQKDLLDLAAAKEEEEKREVDAKGDAALKYREGVSDGDGDPASPASGESTATGGESAVTATDDEKQAQAAAEADQQRAEAAARADEESHQQAAAEDEERFGGLAEDTEPEDTEPVDSEPADKTWLEDDADVDDPDID